MKKILDILIIALLIVLILNLFNGNKEENLGNGKIIFEVTDGSYTIPASVGLNIKNNTSENITLNTCDNIKVNLSWENILFTDNFCKDLTVISWEETILDYQDQFASFQEVWKYVFDIELWEKQYISSFEIENKWTIKKIFTSLFYAPIYNLMIFLIQLFWNSLWWAIISITIIIRFVLLWPQHKMMLSQKKLQVLQPKIKKIQEENKWNQQVLGMKMMELYKKEKVNPMGSCGFLIIQMPILLVIYNIILSIKDPSNFYHIYDFLSGFSLDMMSYDFFGINLLSSWGITWFILALSVWAIQFVQIKLSLADKKATWSKVVLEKKKDTNSYSQLMPDPDMMNKFMLYGMPSMVAVFTFTLFSWVGIYWGMSTLFMVFQQLIVNKILKK